MKELSKMINLNPEVTVEGKVQMNLEIGHFSFKGIRLPNRIAKHFRVEIVELSSAGSPTSFFRPGDTLEFNYSFNGQIQNGESQ